MKSYTIHFIRHGMTEANINGQYAGSWDIPVCEEGKKKLIDLKENFEYPNVKEHYSSPLSRCLQTCDIIYPEAKINIVDGLKEWDFGDWEGKTTFFYDIFILVRLIQAWGHSLTIHLALYLLSEH